MEKDTAQDNKEDKNNHIKPKEKKDPLLESLVIFTKLHGTPFSAEALIAGLPTKEGLAAPELFSLDNPKSAFSRAAGRAGFVSKLVKRDIQDISPLVLPCILNLKNKKACILESLDFKNGTAKIIIPDMGEVVNEVYIKTLQEEYLGYAFFLKQKILYDEKNQIW